MRPEAGLPITDRDGSGALLALGSLRFLARYAEDSAPALCVRYRGPKAHKSQQSSCLALCWRPEKRLNWDVKLSGELFQRRDGASGAIGNGHA